MRGRNFVVLALALALLGPLTAVTSRPALAVSPNVVISQVYGGGGNSGATYTHDFIELFNRGTTAVSISGWSVQYASTTGTSWSKTDLAGTLQPGQYYLIQQAQGAGGTTALPTPDATGTIAMSATAGKVVLLNTNTLITSGTSCPGGTTVVDLVGFGSTTNCFEGSGATPTLSNTTDAIRLGNGCQDTDNNAADFQVAAPNPRNTASPPAPCPVTTSPTGTGAANPNPVAAGGTTLLTVTVTPGANPASTGLAVSADLTQIGGAAAQPFFDDGTNGDATPSDLVFSWQAAVPGATPTGAKTLPATITDAQARSGNTSIALTVDPPATPAAPVTISQVYGGGGNSGAAFSHDFVELYNRSGAPVSITGWSVQYASASGTSWQATAVSGTLQPGQYYLVQLATNNATVGAPLPAPDATGTANMSATAGKVALVNTTTLLTGTGCPFTAAVVDFVGYGTANCFEGSAAAPAPANATAAVRKNAGATDTNVNSADFVVGAPTPRNSTVGFDQAPAVQATTPANGAVNVAVDADVTITFTEPVDVAGAWFTIACATSGSHTAIATGGPTTFTLNPDPDFANGENCTVTVVAAQVTDLDTQDPPDNMAADFAFSFETVALNVCDLSYTPTYAIQGSGAASPLAGSTVSTKAVVVGDFQGTAALNGFYLQDSAGDGDALTSDGLFVFVPSGNPLAGVDVNVGDVVRVTGRVFEFNTLTEIDLVSAITICGIDTPPPPTPVTLPEAVNNDLERYEGMLITFPQALTVTQNFFQGRFGQVSLASGGRLFTPTNQFPPGSPAAVALADENARRLLVLDDGRTSQNPNPIPYIGADDTLRAGDTVAGLTGVLDYGSITASAAPRDYRLQPTVAPVFTRVNHRTSAPPAVGGDLSVAAFNVLNYFNGNGLGGGFPTARGANNLAEFNRQRDKIIAALVAMDADVVGLMELENDAPPHSAIEDLVAGLNAATAPGTYAFVNTGVVGTDQIRVGIVYQPAAVTPVGAHKVLTKAVNPLFDDNRHRPVVAQTFAENASGARFTVAVNHLKSKGSACGAGDDDVTTGQGNCNQSRVNGATALTQWLATDPTGSGDPDFLIIGDLNAYAEEDPITAIESAGYTNLIESFMGSSAYSFTFDGQSGYLDHALATASLASQVTGVTEWHINADEPSVLDYNTEFKSQDLYTPTPYRSADHDPVLVGLELNMPPTVGAGGFYSVAEGGNAGLTASGSDPEGGTLAYAWDLDDDGTFETAGQTATFSAAGLDGPGSAVVKVRATDPGGLTAVESATIAILNAPPVVATPSTSPAPSTPGQAVVAAATFADPGPADGPFACSVDYGAGAGPQPGTVGGGSCTGPAHTYASIGTYVVTVAVTDKDGGTGSNTVAHHVQFAFTGFFAPVANQPTLNEIKAGQKVPVKFSLSGDKGLGILATGYPKSQQVACDTSLPTSDLTTIESPGSSGLSYDAATDTYNVVWATSKAWAGTCRLLIVKLVDGTSHTAVFRLR